MQNLRLPKIGVWSLINSLQVLKVLTKSDIDFVVVDFEHGYWNSDQVSLAVDICHKDEKYLVMRIPTPSQEYVQLAYDSQVDILQIAGIRSQSDVDKIVTLVNVPPLGTLGYSPWTPQGYTRGERSESGPKLSVQIEEINFLNDFLNNQIQFPEEISSIFLGRYDLSVSMGIPGQISHEKIMNLIDMTSQSASKLDLEFGTVSNSLEDVKSLKNFGLHFISVGSDIERLLGSSY